MRFRTTTYEEQMCQVFHRFIEARGGESGSLDECYEFAKTNGLYDPRRPSERALFRREMSRALSRERLIDESGTPIRCNHVLRQKLGDGQGFLFIWGELMRMPPDQVRLSMQQRLLGLAKRAIQLDRDKTYYNDHNTFGAQLELDYNLTPHVEQAKNPTEYPEERPATE